jgi:beta-N-acetylhexosaminidase
MTGGTSSDGPTTPGRGAEVMTVARRCVATSASLAVSALVLAAGLVGCHSAARNSPTGLPADRPITPPSMSSPPHGTDLAAAKAAKVVATLSDTDLVGQVLVPELYGESATKVTSAAATANQRMAGVSTPAEIVDKFRLGGVILANRASDDPTEATNATTNIVSAAQVRTLDAGLQGAAAKLPDGAPLLIGTDQEYGVVTRLRSGVVQLPSAMALGAAHDPSLTQSAWAAAGNDLGSVGLTADFAPDADVLAGAANTVIGSRSFGDTATDVSAQVGAAVSGLRSAGIATAIKHFPGHGGTDVDSHKALPVLSQTLGQLTSVDLAPFRSGIAAGTEMVMVGHLDVRAVDPGMPATFSSKVINDLLRTQLGFQGVVITDALNMAPVTERWSSGEAAVRAILAGDDMLLMPANLVAAQRGLLAAVRSGRLPRSHLVATVTRILTMKFRLAANAKAHPAGTVDSAAERSTVGTAAAAAVTVLSGACHGPLVSGAVRVTSRPGYSGTRARLAAALKADGVHIVASGGTLIDIVGYADGRNHLATGAAVTIAVDTPYVLRYATSEVRIATYSSTAASMTALAAVLAGRTGAAGRSPVAVAGLPRTACPARS